MRELIDRGAKFGKGPVAVRDAIGKLRNLGRIVRTCLPDLAGFVAAGIAVRERRGTYRLNGATEIVPP